jgi:uncharacterized protein YukE
MNWELSKPVRQLIALALPLGLIALLWISVLQPLADIWSNHRTRIEQQAVMLERYKDIASRQGTLQQKLEQLRAETKGQTGFWKGANATHVAATIQANLRQMVIAAGGTVRSTLDLPATSEGGFQRIGIEIDGEGDIVAVRKTLAAIESAQPYLFIGDLDLRAPEFIPAANKDVSPKLSMRFDVFAYLEEQGS